ncbi:MAG: cell division protein FtsQ/DivIB [Amphritea sp.]|nr:cell division protein FtsQ/DivIB [Amphritea sp.]
MLRKLFPGLDSAPEQQEEEPVLRGASVVRKPETDSPKAGFEWKLPRFNIDSDWWLKPATILTALAVFVAISGKLYGHVYSWLDQPVGQVVIEGEMRHLQRQALANESVALMNGGLLSADLVELKEGIQAHPWVYQVGVARQWPATLYLQIREEVPVARWGSNGLLNHEGDIFWPEQMKAYSDLPLMQGPAGDTALMMEQYYDLNQMLRTVGLQVTELKFEARGAWTLTLENGIRVVIGREQVVERLERFLTVYRVRLKEEADAGRIEQIDIRYNNGMAVKWHPQNDEAKQS